MAREKWETNAERILSLIESGALEDSCDRRHILFNGPDREALVAVLRGALNQPASPGCRVIERHTLVFRLADSNVVHIDPTHPLTPETLQELIEYLEVHATALRRRAERESG